MRTIDRSSAFKRDYKREAKGQHRATLDDALKPVLVALATDQPLDARYRDLCWNEMKKLGLGNDGTGLPTNPADAVNTGVKEGVKGLKKVFGF